MVFSQQVAELFSTSNNRVLSNLVKVPLIVDRTVFTIERSCRSVLAIHLMHLSQCHMGQPLPQSTLRLASLVHLNSCCIDEVLAFYSYSESYKLQLRNLPEPICSS